MQTARKYDSAAHTFPLNGVSCDLAFVHVFWIAVARWHWPFSEGPYAAEYNEIQMTELRSQAVKVIMVLLLAHIAQE